MKKIIISVIAAIFITVVIPLAVVEFVRPGENAESTKPHTEEINSAEQV